MTPSIYSGPDSAEDNSWMSVSDLMAGLMVIFLFILIAFVRPIVETNQKVDDIAKSWDAVETEIFKALDAEFRDDLPKWRAVLIPETLTVRFQAPEVLFSRASAELSPEFAAILADFFPRYVGVLTSFDQHIEEIRIEGHTSSEWEGASSEDEAYFQNMALSQNRTRSVLKFGLGTLDGWQPKQWARSRLTANGMSSNRLVYQDNTLSENPEASRRVEFRVVTDFRQELDRVRDVFEIAGSETDGALRP